MLRVRHIVRQYAPAIGGLENFVHSLAKSLAEFNCESDVLTLDRTFLNGNGRLSAHDRIDGIVVDRVPMIGHRRLFTPIVSAPELRNYDVLHVHGIDGMFERIARHPKLPNQICVATSHGLFFHTPWMSGLKEAYFATVTKIAAQRYDQIIANSAPDEARLHTLGRPLVQIPNGVAPIGDFTAHGRDLLCLGRLSSHKRIDRLIAMMAFPALADAVLHIIGPDWDVSRSTLQAQIEALGVQDRVHLHGRVSAGRLAEIAAQCGVFVSASDYEGFGMSLIEAASIGLIPAVSPNASFKQLITEGGLGVMTSFERPDVAAAVVASVRARLDPPARAQARAFAQRFSWERNAGATASLYRTLLAQRARAR